MRISKRQTVSYSKNIFVHLGNGLAFLVSEVQSGNSSLKKPASGMAANDVSEESAFTADRRNGPVIMLAGSSCCHICHETIKTRVARWYLFKPKIPIWANFGGPWNGKGWHTIWPIRFLRAILHS
jgi:hypothetical protein